MTSRLIQLRSAIVAAVQALAGAGVDVASHFGRFSETELTKFMACAPAVRVAIMAVEDPRPVADEGVDYTARVGVYVVTKDAAVAGGRDDAAASLVEAILVLCDRNRWGLGSFVQAAKGATAANLHSDAALGAGNALWAIDLRQPIRLAPPASDAPPVSALFLDVVPRVGAAHEADYLRVPADV